FKKVPMLTLIFRRSCFPPLPCLFGPFRCSHCRANPARMLCLTLRNSKSACFYFPPRTFARRRLLPDYIYPPPGDQRLSYGSCEHLLLTVQCQGSRLLIAIS